MLLFSKGRVSQNQILAQKRGTDWKDFKPFLDELAVHNKGYYTIRYTNLISKSLRDQILNISGENFPSLMKKQISKLQKQIKEA